MTENKKDHLSVVPFVKKEEEDTFDDLLTYLTENKEDIQKVVCILVRPDEDDSDLSYYEVQSANIKSAWELLWITERGKQFILG